MVQKQSQISYLSLSISSNLLKFCFQFMLQKYLISIFQKEIKIKQLHIFRNKCARSAKKRYCSQCFGSIQVNKMAALHSVLRIHYQHIVFTSNSTCSNPRDRRFENFSDTNLDFLFRNYSNTTQIAQKILQDRIILRLQYFVSLYASNYCFFHRSCKTSVSRSTRSPHTLSE